MKISLIIVGSLLAVSALGEEVKAPSETHSGSPTNRPTEQKPTSASQTSGSFQFKGEVGSKLNSRQAQSLDESAVQPDALYHSYVKMQPPKPNNVIRSRNHPGIEYSGILVQLDKNNPLQLINPFAPAKYGDGEVNIVRNPTTRRAEGLKIFQISF
jgi:hypothetical protein